MFKQSLLGLLASTMIVAATPAAQAETLRWARSADATTLDPHALNNNHNHVLLHQVYEPLLVRALDGSLQPTLAESWRLTKDASVWEFKLRKGVKFHDGSVLTADDVVFSLQRAQADTSDMKALLVSIGEVRKIDPFTVQIHTKGPNPLLPNNLTNIQIMSQAWARQYKVEQPQSLSAKGETYATRNENGTGPYVLVSRDPDTRTVLKKFPEYWGRGQFPLEIDELVYLPIKSAATRVAALLSGEVDFVQDMPIQDVGRLRSDSRLRVNQGPENRVIFLGLNVGAEPLQFSNIKDRNPLANPKVREALQLAIDRKALQTVVMRGLSVPTNIVAPPFVHGYEKRFDVIEKPDLAKSKKLLAEAGFPNGFDITLHCTNDRYLNDEGICQAVAGFLGRIGIKVQVAARPVAQISTAIHKQEVDFYLYGWGVPTYDSAYIFDYLVHTRGVNGRGSNNATRFSDPALDAQIAALSSEPDVKRRDASIQQIWTRLEKERIYLPLHTQIQSYAMARRFDIPVNASGPVFFKGFRVQR